MVKSSPPNTIEGEIIAKHSNTMINFIIVSHNSPKNPLANFSLHTCHTHTPPYYDTKKHK